MGYLTRDEILAVQDFKTAEVDVPEWGGTGKVRVRELSAAQVEKIGLGVTTATGDMDLTQAQGLIVKLVAGSVIDENGTRLFTEQDVEALGDKSFGVLSRIATAVMELSDLSEVTEKNE